MINFQRLARVSAILGALALVGMLFAHLALTDIWHAAESDLSLEWCVVRLSFLLQAAFVLVASLALWQGWKAQRLTG